MDCPCGQEMKTRMAMSLCFGEEVEVRYCLCGRERTVVEYGPYDKAKTGHEKFTIQAEALSVSHQAPRNTFG